jgi:hypothetical protein
MKNTPISRLQVLCRQIKGLTQAIITQHNGAPSDKRSFVPKNYPWAVLNNDFSRSFTPTLDKDDQSVSFIIARNDDQLSLVIKTTTKPRKRWTREEYTVKSCVGLPADEFRLILRAFIADLRVAPQDWLALLQRHFITEALDDTDYRHAQHDSYIAEQQTLYQTLETLAEQQRKAEPEVTALYQRYNREIKDCAETAELARAKQAVLQAETDLKEKRVTFSQAIGLTDAARDRDALQTQLSALSDKIDWSAVG